jgi:hypothetical protein
MRESSSMLMGACLCRRYWLYWRGGTGWSWRTPTRCGSRVSSLSTDYQGAFIPWMPGLEDPSVLRGFGSNSGLGTNELPRPLHGLPRLVYALYARA